MLTLAEFYERMLAQHADATLLHKEDPDPGSASAWRALRDRYAFVIRAIHHECPDLFQLPLDLQ